MDDVGRRSGPVIHCASTATPVNPTQPKTT
jgi:hypothetical protein